MSFDETEKCVPMEVPEGDDVADYVDSDITYVSKVCTGFGERKLGADRPKPRKGKSWVWNGHVGFDMTGRYVYQILMLMYCHGGKMLVFNSTNCIDSAI